MAPLRMAVVGVGHLGQAHARILDGLPDVELVGVVDVNPKQAESVGDKLGVPAYTDYWPLLRQVDAASIVVPTTHHLEVAKAFLEQGLPLLVEKPIAASLQEAQQLVDLSEDHNTLLQVGHIERFNPAYLELRQRPLQPKFIRAERVGPFTGRSTDIGVVLDLMIHDLDLILEIVSAPIASVEALGVTLFGEHEDIANARVRFTNGCVAELTASRATPMPSRKMQIWASEGFVTIDFQKRELNMIQPSGPLRQFGLDVQQMDPVSRARLKDDLFTRHLPMLQLDCMAGDQLTAELEHFLECVRTGQQPCVNAVDGMNAIALANQVLEKVRKHQWEGRPEGHVGPKDMPEPMGNLFTPRSGEAAA
ncbi:MAG: Gfo/Idh/MocA family oxidoreductase [Gemmataceae bacterium]